MIDIRQAIANAKSYATDVLGIHDLLLEEVHSRENFFEITLSFPRRVPRPNPLLRQRNEYKTFQVNKETGEVEGMSIPKIA